MDGIEGLAAGDPVTAAQMRALFGCGLHPLAELRQQQLERPDLTPRDLQEVTRLKTPECLAGNRPCSLSASEEWGFRLSRRSRRRA